MNDNEIVLIKQFFKDNFSINQEFIYVSGSLLEGFGNCKSDIDIYVIVRANEMQQNFDAVTIEKSKLVIDETGNIKMFAVSIDMAKKYDIEFWNLEEVVKACKKINDFVLDENIYVKAIPNDYVDLIHRMKFGKALYKEGNFNEFISQINFYNLNLYLYKINYYYYSSFLEDVEGAYLDKDFGTALFLAKDMSICIITSFLALMGETNPNVKWLYRKFLQFLNQNTVVSKEEKQSMFKEFYEIQGITISSTELGTKITTILDYCQRVNSKAQFYLYGDNK